MAPLRPPVGEIPLPLPTPVSAPFWDGCREGRLLFQRCRACGTALSPPTRSCRACPSREVPEWEESAGTGSLYSWSTVWRPQAPTFPTPYVAAIVDLGEGFALLSNVVGCDSDEVTPGMRLRVTFHPNGSVVIPYFEPDGGEALESPTRGARGLP